MMLRYLLGFFSFPAWMCGWGGLDGRLTINEQQLGVGTSILLIALGLVLFLVSCALDDREGWGGGNNG